MFKLNRKDVIILIIILVLFIISLIIIQDFIIPLVFAFILTYILNPFYRKTLKLIKSQAIVSLIFSFLILFIIIIPISLLSLNLTKEINSINDDSIINNLNIITNDIKNKYDINIDLQKQYDLLLGEIKIKLHDFFYKIPSFLFQIFLIIFFYYYFSKDYNLEIRFFRKQFRSKDYLFIKKEFEKLINGIIYGQIFVRLVQSIVAIFAFLIIGLNGAIISGILIFFAGFLPVVGTGIIWLPLALIKFLNHDYYIGIIILIIGIFISLIDNFLLPYVISEKTKIGPIITLISILGGIEFFGLYGIILGPFIIGTLVILIEDVLGRLNFDNLSFNRFIWKPEERDKYRKLKTNIAKENFKEMMNKKYFRGL